MSTAPVRPEITYKPPAKGWIRAIRDALGMGSEQLARRLSLRSQSIDDWEKAEANGSIQLKTLCRAVDALDCTLVYALIPKTSLENAVQSRARKIAMRDLRQTTAISKRRLMSTLRAGSCYFSPLSGIRCSSPKSPLESGFGPGSCEGSS